MAGNGSTDPLGEMISRFMREVFDSMTGDGSGGGGDIWSQVSDKVRRGGESSTAEQSQRRENLAFALADRAVTALEDIALNVAAVRQRLEKVTKTPADYVRAARQRMEAAGEDPDREVHAAGDDDGDNLWSGG